MSVKEWLEPLVTKKQEEPETRVRRGWVEYASDKSTMNHIVYEMEWKDRDGVWTRGYKVISLFRVLRLPKSDKLDTKFMEMMSQVLSGLYSRDVDWMVMAVNIIYPKAIGLLHMYGVQAIDENLEVAKQKCRNDFASIQAAMQGTFRIMEFRRLNHEEAEWLREKLSSMRKIFLLRGIPEARKSAAEGQQIGWGQDSAGDASEGTAEDFIAGLAGHEYALVVLGSSIPVEVLNQWRTQLAREMTVWNGQLQGTRSISAGLSMPFMFGANMGTQAGYSHGVNSGTAYGHTVGEGLSHTVTNGTTVGQTVGQSVTQGHGINVGHNVGTSQGDSFSASQNLSNTASVGTSHSIGLTQGHSVGQTTGNSYQESVSSGQNVSQSLGTSASHSTGESYGTSDSFGYSGGTSQGVSSGQSISSGHGITEGTSQGTTQGSSNSIAGNVGVNLGASLGTSAGSANVVSHNIGETSGSNSSLTHAANIGTNSGVSQGMSDGWGHSMNTSATNSTGQTAGVSTGSSIGQSYSSGVSHSISSQDSVSSSASVGTSQNFGVSKGMGTSEGQTAGISNGYSSGASANDSVGNTKSNSIAESESTANGTSVSVSNSGTASRGVSDGYSGGWSNGVSASGGIGPSLSFGKSYQWIDQEVAQILQQLEYQNNRLMLALAGQGAFFIDVFVATPDEETQAAAETIARTAWVNEKAYVNPLEVVEVPKQESNKALYHMNAFSPLLDRVSLGNINSYKYSTMLLANEAVAYSHPIRMSEGGIFADVDSIPILAVPSMRDGPIHMGKILSGERWTTSMGYRTPFNFQFSDGEIHHGVWAAASRTGKTEAALRFAVGVANKSRAANGKPWRVIVMDPKQDWRRLALFVDADRFRFYSLANQELYPIQINLLKVPKGVYPQFYMDMLVNVYCRAYQLNERGREILTDVIAALYDFEGAFVENWREVAPIATSRIGMIDVYEEVERRKRALEEARGPQADREALSRVAERLKVFSRPYAIETKLFGQAGDFGIEDLLGDDDVVVLESYGLEEMFKKFVFGQLTNAIFQIAQGHQGGYFAPDQFPTMLFVEEANEILVGETADGNSIGLPGISQFEKIVDQAAGLGLIVQSITQKPSKLPSSIIANSGIFVVGRLAIREDIETMIVGLGRDPKRQDIELFKWLPRSPIGWMIVRASRNLDYKQMEPSLVEVERLPGSSSAPGIPLPDNDQLQEIVERGKLERELKKAMA